MDSTCDSSRLAGKGTAEYKVVHQYFSTLVEDCSTCLTFFSNILFSKNLLTQFEHKKILDSTKLPYDKATETVRIILSKIESDNSNFKELLWVLCKCELDQVSDALKSSLSHEKSRSSLPPPEDGASKESSGSRVHQNTSSTEEYEHTAEHSLRKTSSAFPLPHEEQNLKPKQSSFMPGHSTLSGAQPPDTFDGPRRHPEEDDYKSFTVLQRSEQPTQSGLLSSDMVTKNLSHHVFHGQRQANVYPSLRRIPAAQPNLCRFLSSSQSESGKPSQVSFQHFKAHGTVKTPMLNSQLDSSAYPGRYSAPSAPDFFKSADHMSHTDVQESHENRQMNFACANTLEIEAAYYKKEAAHREDENADLKRIIGEQKKQLIEQNNQIQDLQKRLIHQCLVLESLEKEKSATDSRLRTLKTKLVEAKHGEFEAEKRAMESSKQYEENLEVLSQQLCETREKGFSLCYAAAQEQLCTEKEALKRRYLALLGGVSTSNEAACVPEMKRWSCEASVLLVEDETSPDGGSNLLMRLEALDLCTDKL